MKYVWTAIRQYFFLTVLLGLVYPILTLGIGKIFFPYLSAGSILYQDGQIVGSELIAQKFEADEYFWPRPSATNFSPQPSGGSNLGPTSATLRESYNLTQKKWGLDAPQSLLFASGSGLDPELDPAAALYQIPRIAKARSLPEDAIRSLVLANTIGRQFGFLGESRINVLNLNRALDKIR